MLDRDHQDQITVEAKAAAFMFYKAGQLLQNIMGTVDDFAMALNRPSVLYRPKLYQDGDQWCALYGDNLQDGVCGFGDTPAAAIEAFDRAWRGEPDADAEGSDG